MFPFADVIMTRNCQTKIKELPKLKIFEFWIFLYATMIRCCSWCRKAPRHYMSQSWLRFLSSYGVIRPQWLTQYIISGNYCSCSPYSAPRHLLNPCWFSANWTTRVGEIVSKIISWLHSCIQSYQCRQLICPFLVYLWCSPANIHRYTNVSLLVSPISRA